jgi:DNA repair exonuclease SbcCD nuclease subunit
MRSRYKITPREDVLIQPGFLNPAWAYVALGHIHQPQHLPGLPNVRYSGPLDRLDFGEIADDRGVWLVDVGPAGLRGDPAWLPLDPTPMLDLAISTADDLAAAVHHPQRETAFVRVTVGADLPRDDTVKALRKAFPRWHQITCAEDAPPAVAEGTEVRHEYSTADLAGSVRTYLEREIRPDDPDRQAMLALADTFLAEAAQ